MPKSFVLITTSSRKPGRPRNELIRKPLSKSAISYLSGKMARLAEISRALDMDRAQMDRIRVMLSDLLPKYLNLKKPFRAQDKTSLESLKMEAHRKMPVLDRYEDGWATDVYIKRIYYYKATYNTSRPHFRFAQTPPPPAPPPPPSSLMEFLQSAEPKSSHLFFLFACNGLSDERFPDFLALPLDAKKAFVHSILRSAQVPDKYAQGMLAAVEKLPC